jgi:hypothetical protein
MLVSNLAKKKKVGKEFESKNLIPIPMMGRVLSWFTPGALAADPVARKSKEFVASNASVGGGPPNHATLPFPFS